MKKNILSVSVVLVSLNLFSQGINFEQTTWSDVLARATKLNKPVFIDVYTTWCGPCKQMSKNIFPLEKVGSYFNENYICFKIDAEKGDGIEVCKTYNIEAYPTYLFIKPTGEMFYQSLGSMPSAQFIQVGKDALSDMNNPISYPVLVKEYPANKNNIAFMQLYIEKRRMLSMSSDSLLEEYLSLLSPAQLSADSTLSLLCSENNSIQFGSMAYSILTENRERIMELGTTLRDNYNHVIYKAIYKVTHDAIRNKSEIRIEEAIRQNAFTLKGDNNISNDQIWMNYYEGTWQREKFVALATKYLDSTIMNLSLEEVKAWDADNYKKWRETTTNEDSAKMEPNEWKKSVKYAKMHYSYRYASGLNEIAWNLLQIISDKQALTKALGWSKRSLELAGEENGALLDTYANLLYRLGNVPEAIKYETKAIEKGKEDMEDSSDYEETLEIMKKGEPTPRYEKVY